MLGLGLCLVGKRSLVAIGQPVYVEADDLASLGKHVGPVAVHGG